ncbi:Retrovirus-related polyprotein from transposon [Salix suchowensis]|nr:Retrovirus-related polyprotein from transposon [Salix suchowensis]
MSTLSLNVGNFVTLRLTPSNYPLWREQALALAESQEMVDHLTNEDPPPAKHADTDTQELTESFKAWRKTDRLLRGWIIGTLSEEALGLIVGLDTSHAVWEALKNAYAQNSQEREFTLRQQVTYLRKEENTSITEHIRTFKSICDNLAAIGKTIPNQEKVFCLLTSLGPHYETFTTTMLKPPRPSYTELVSQLQSLDQRRNWLSSHTDNTAPSATHQLAFYGQHQQRPQSKYTNYRRTQPAYSGYRGARVISMFCLIHQNYISPIGSNQPQQKYGINA